MNAVPDTALPLDAAAAYRETLIEAGLLISTGIDGLYGRSDTFESVVEGIDDALSRMTRNDGAERLRFPPLLGRQDFLTSGYLKSFPQLVGTVHCFCGDDKAHRRLLAHVEAGEDFSAEQVPAETVLTPAACYPVYPVLARRGAVPAEGRLVDIASYCFRHEPSLDPARMQMFRMREQVRLGTADQVLSFRENWLTRARDLIAALQLPGDTDIANDPFFGRRGKLMADGQRDQRLKFEMLIPVARDDAPTACVSFNYHMTHFAETWGLHDEKGELIHSGCVGFGMERMTLALFRHHGLDPAHWPAGVRNVLWPAS